MTKTVALGDGYSLKLDANEKITGIVDKFNRPAYLTQSAPTISAVDPTIKAITQLDDGSVISSDGTTIIPAGTTGTGTNTTLSSYSDFSLVANGTSISALQPIRGVPYVLNGSAATVQSGFVVPSTTGVYYATQTHLTPIDKAVIEFSLQGTVTATLPTTTIAIGAAPTLATGVLHLQTSPHGGTLMVRYTGGVADVIAQFNWDFQLLADGTVYRMALATYGNRVVISGPNGESFSVTDKRILDIRGNQTFFEGLIESNASYTKVKRFYTTSSNTTSYPNPYQNPNEISALTGFSHNGIGNPAALGGTTSEVSFGAAAQGYPQISLGPISYFSSTLLAAVAIGAGTFTTDTYLPAGSYTIDLTSAGGANAEIITVASMAGGTSPFTATLTGTFAKSHAASVRGASVTIVSNFQGTPKAIYVDQFGLTNMPDNTTIIGGLRLRTGSDYYSCTFKNISANYARFYDIGPGNPSSLGVSGGFRVVEGANHYAGVGTLVGGTLTISTTAVLTGDRIELSRQASGAGALGHLSVGTITNATSFVINSSAVTDVSDVFWEIRRPG
jgi:hypothetical protein